MVSGITKTVKLKIIQERVLLRIWMKCCLLLHGIYSPWKNTGHITGTALTVLKTGCPTGQYIQALGVRIHVRFAVSMHLLASLG